MDELLSCPICDGPATVKPSSPTNIAMCGFKGWTADCIDGCEGAPYVSRLFMKDAVAAWNELVFKRRAAQQSKGEQQP